METRIISWEKYIKDLEALVKQIRKSRLKFDSIVGVKRGGIIPAVFMSHQLEVPFGGAKSPDMRILIVDDISDTGKTLEKYTLSSNLFTLATLYIKEGTRVVPDFYVEKFPKGTWIIYPYERSFN